MPLALFVPTGFAVRLLAILEHVLLTGTWMIVTALPGDGKSTALDRFVTRHAAHWVDLADGKRRRVVPVLATRVSLGMGSAERLMVALAHGLGAVPNLRGYRFRDWLVGAIADAGVRMIVIDDAHENHSRPAQLPARADRPPHGCRGGRPRPCSTKWLTASRRRRTVLVFNQMVEHEGVDMAAADQLSQVFSALADPTRRDMVARLSVADATVNELAEPYDVSVQAISKHLRVLEDAGLVSRRREAQRRPVHLEADVFDLMTTWIERYRRRAEERYQRLDALLADLPDEAEGEPK